MYKTKHFKIEELLPEELVTGTDKDWNLFDERLLKTADWIRNTLGIPLVCNNWKAGGERSYCGARTKASKQFKPGSFHSVRPDRKVMAMDVISDRMTGQEMRDHILENYQDLPFPIRIEENVSWLHFDVNAVEGYKIYFFHA